MKLNSYYTLFGPKAPSILHHDIVVPHRNYCIYRVKDLDIGKTRDSGTNRR